MVTTLNNANRQAAALLVMLVELVGDIHERGAASLGDPVVQHHLGRGLSAPCPARRSKILISKNFQLVQPGLEVEIVGEEEQEACCDDDQ